MTRLTVSLCLLVGASTCRRDGDDGAAPAAPPAEQATRTVSEAKPLADNPAHHVVFADRTSQAYLLLLPTQKPPKTPTRAELRASAKANLGSEEAEVDLLFDLIDMEPKGPRAPTDKLDADDLERASKRANDLLGLHVEIIDLQPTDGRAVIPKEVFADPVLTRDLQPDEIASAPERRYALLLRADYRNQHAVRGLRLLQTLVRVIGAEHKALIHDPDTRETLSLEAFSRRRLQASLGNVADQVAVVPFSDPKHGSGHVRLTTRGMRRFGSVDLELDGLPPDQELLLQATHFIYGLAFQMVRLGEVDPSGFAVEVGDTVSVHYRDVSQAYSSRMVKVPRCRGCPEEVMIHLVERAREDHDPEDHVVARIVAPRSTSQQRGYDHPSWVRDALARVLGPTEP